MDNNSEVLIKKWQIFKLGDIKMPKAAEGTYFGSSHPTIEGHSLELAEVNCYDTEEEAKEALLHNVAEKESTYVIMPLYYVITKDDVNKIPKLISEHDSVPVIGTFCLTCRRVVCTCKSSSSTLKIDPSFAFNPEKSYYTIDTCFPHKVSVRARYDLCNYIDFYTGSDGSLVIENQVGNAPQIKRLKDGVMTQLIQFASKPTPEQIVEMALLFGEKQKQVDKERIIDMVSMSSLIIDRLFETGDITKPTKEELEEREINHL
jgi:hypothetical protein